MISRRIDINCDMGEGIGNESQLMPYISSCNIACGGHAGDIMSMNRVISLALQHYVKIGAHPSLPDKKNFGRCAMKISRASLASSLKQQIKLLMMCLKDQKAHLNHVKPHGALYNIAIYDECIAQMIVETTKSISRSLTIYAPNHSLLADIARSQDILVISEGFADRRYHNDLSLVDRNKAKAIHHHPEEVVKQVLDMIIDGQVQTLEGDKKVISVETICIHGDHKNTPHILKILNKELIKNNIIIK